MKEQNMFFSIMKHSQSTTIIVVIHKDMAREQNS